MTTRLSVLTTAWNSGEALSEWSRAWAPFAGELIVGDNGSTDGAPGSCGAEVVETGGNAGFGGGINAAAAVASGDLILVTNPDTLPGPDGSVDALLRGFEPGSLTGAALTGGDGEALPSGGVWPSVGWVAGQVIHRAASLWRRDRLDWVQGALMLMERELFLSLGGFSDEFPLYWEDTDLCASAAERGIPRRIVGDSVFLHREGTGAPRSRAVRLAGFHWGLWRWFARHRPGSASTVRALLVLKCAGRTALGRGGASRKGYRESLSALVSGRRPVLPEAGRPEGRDG